MTNNTTFNYSIQLHTPKSIFCEEVATLSSKYFTVEEVFTFCNNPIIQYLYMRLNGDNIFVLNSKTGELILDYNESKELAHKEASNITIS